MRRATPPCLLFLRRPIFLPVLILLLVSAVSFAQSASAQTSSPQPNNPQANNPQIQQDYLEKARVVTASQSQITQVPGTSVSTQRQAVTITVLSGHDTGTTVSFENDYPTQVKTGDIIYVRHTTGGDSPDLWAISDTYRIPILVGLALVFLALVFVFGGLPGVRGIASLAGSMILIFYVLLPGIYAGLSATLLAIGVASLIIIVGSYITHGFTRTTTAAVFGMILTVLVTGALAYWAVHMAHLTGFTNEENAYLNFNTAGKIDMVGLLFGGIMIGLLGVLYDIAIGQAVAVEELFRASVEYSRTKVYRRALRIGREHIGALVNTLAIAYVGASLPILLLLHDSTAGIGYVLNSERFATEIIRILIGSIGLVLAVPITTLIASYMLRHNQGRE
jgi:uncharacterized membrane protein